MPERGNREAGKVTFGGSREGVGIFYMYTFAYTYSVSRFESPVFIGWFESSTGNSLRAVFLYPEKNDFRQKKQ